MIGTVLKSTLLLGLGGARLPDLRDEDVRRRVLRGRPLDSGGGSEDSRSLSIHTGALREAGTARALARLGKEANE